MRPSRFSDEEILRALRDVREGTPAAALCRRLGITETTFYRWRAKHEGDSQDDATTIADLRAENLRLKELIAELLLETRKSR